MTVIGLGKDDRQLLDTIDFSRNVRLEFWVFLEEFPVLWHDIFSVRGTEAQNELSVKLRNRSLKVYHGNGNAAVTMLEQDISPRALPANHWVQVSVHRQVTRDTISLEVTLKGGEEPQSIHVDCPTQKSLPHTFSAEDRPQAVLLSDAEHIGFMSGFRFEGANGRYVAYRDGGVVSNVETQYPLRHLMKLVERGTENQGVFLHTLRSSQGGNYHLVEKKTKKILEIEFVKFLDVYQKYDPSLRRIFPAIHWAEEANGSLTYIMEYIHGTWDRRKANTVEVFDLVLENLKELKEVGASYGVADRLPDTITEFNNLIPDVFSDPGFGPVHDKLDSYLSLRSELTEYRTLLSHNDVWGTNIAVPLGATRSRLIDIGRVSMNFVGADLLHFRRYFSEFGEKGSQDQQVWKRVLNQYADAFSEDPELTEIGTIAYAAEREIERNLRRRAKGFRPLPDRLNRLLAALPPKL